MLRSTRDLRSRLVRLEGAAGERTTPEAVQAAARRRIADGAFPDDASERLRINAIMLLVDALDDGWNPATDSVPLPADPNEIDYMGLGGCSDPVPVADPALQSALLSEAAALGVNPIAF